MKPGSPTIVVKKLTKEIVTEAIEAYAKDEGYWLKLCQFGDHLDISVLNKLDATFREECSLFYLEGFDYYLQKYVKISPENRVLLELMLFFTFLSSIAYCLLKPGLFDFFYNLIS
uniref:Uncharacterized protein n=1 Tax=Navicula veneta TaxID=138539 RepID=A0A8F1B8E4_9STRA|nr:hypothetical protein KYX03_pgp003 [Navicula veneta]QWM93670.1 hypothetical protein [Navicula veneta]